MNREDITRMAREAGWTGYDSQDERFALFAAFVAAAEREACANVCESEETLMSDHKAIGAQMCADAIRARGTT